MLNIERHKQVLSKLLIDLARQKTVSAQLGFKGGTALYFFYDLDRFSVDLDFDWLGDENFDLSSLDSIVEKNLTVLEKRKKYFTWLWIGSYEKGFQRVKVEINTRKYPNQYEARDFRGYSIRVMKPEYMLAHKLCAILDRKNLQNRDLYDAWFMFNKGFSSNEEIVELRTGKKLKAYLNDLLEFVNALPNGYDVLNGLGEVVDERKKNWIKNNMLDELKAQIASRA
jgi:predicted nucleotidyltransferase component of viral defense system